jgi:glycosyltransferase involved in cell wall biosynthesis
MRLLFVHERLGALGGAESNVLSTATELRGRGHEVGLLHGESTGKNEAGWHSAFPSRYLLPGTATAAATVRALEQFSPDIVYVHKMADLEVIEALLQSKARLVRMVHDHDIYCLRSYKYDYFTRKICHRPVTPFCIFPCLATVVRNHTGPFPIRWASYGKKKEEVALNRRFDRMIVISRYMRDELLQNGFEPGRIRIHSPVPRMGDPGVQAQFSDRNLIVFAGQIIRGKGVDILLESLAKLKSPFECVVLGDGNQKSACEAQAVRLGLSGRVTFKGFVPQEELKTYYRDASLFVFSSVWPEPFGLAGIEAMRYGLPVVAFDAGGISDWLMDGENGFLVPWMDRDAYAARIDQLLQNKSLARALGTRAREIAGERFDFTDYIDGLESLMHEVNDLSRPPGK